MAPQVAQILEAISYDTSLLLSSIVDVHAEGNSNLKPDNEFHRVGEIDHMQFPHMEQAAVNEKVISSDVILGGREGPNKEAKEKAKEETLCGIFQRPRLFLKLLQNLK